MYHDDKNYSLANVQAVPFIMQEVYLCGVDVDDHGLTVPRICCPTEALGSIILETSEPATTTTTTTTTTTAPTTTTEPVPWYRLHPGFRHLANLETCGRTFVVDVIRTITCFSTLIRDFDALFSETHC